MSLPPSAPVTPASPAVPQAQLQQLFALFSARRYAEMEARARALLTHHPQAGEVWKGLSVALQVQGKPALEALQQATALLPGDAELASNLGNLLSDQGRAEEAVGCYARALTLNVDFADAHSNLGLALTRLGRLDDTAASLQRALLLRPAFAVAHLNLGNVRTVLTDEK